MLVGYTGCNQNHAEYAHFNSSEANRAFQINPKLCPEGKFGFDPRCRDWYHTGKMKYEKNNNWSHFTAPYKFANSNFFGQTASMPIVDPNTNMHVGQSVVDFTIQQILDVLDEMTTPLLKDGFHILIASEQDDFNSETIIAPGYFHNKTADPIAKFVLPHDDCKLKTSNNIYCRDFDRILVKMQAGYNGTEEFARTTSDGSSQKLHLSYAPVYATTYIPHNSSDFSQGVNESRSVIFSLALVNLESSLLQENGGKELLLHTVRLSIAALSILVVLIAFLVIRESYVISLLITTPITRLLHLLQRVNRKNIEDDLPRFDRTSTSKEVLQVYNTFDQLYKVIRFANTAFLAGDLCKANKVLIDALELFTHLNNTKAISIANNNLGGIMLTMYRTLQSTGKDYICDMSKQEIILKGKFYFDASIDLGEKAIARINDEEGWSTNYLLYMQQLSNRYFNRAMFLFAVRDDLSGDAISLGFTDLRTSQDMDIEVVDNGDQVGYKGDDDAYFNLILRRIRGLLILMKASLPDKWGIEDLLTNAVEIIINARRDSGESVLFVDVAMAGRMQQLDILLIEYFSSIKGDTREAARIGVRMLMEDDYVLPDAALKALEALKRYTEVSNVEKSEEGYNNNDTRRELESYITKLSQRGYHKFKESIMGDITLEKI